MSEGRVRQKLCLAEWRRYVQSDRQSLTVYFDGACPLCRAEIDHYRGQEGAGTICFLDVSRSEEALAADLTKQQAMKRFHVRRNDGLLLSGATAFVAVWSTLPRWQRAARLAALPGVLTILEVAYRLFLPVRPTLSKLFGLVRAWRQPHNAALTDTAGHIDLSHRYDEESRARLLDRDGKH